jgi:hypothetical protein
MERIEAAGPFGGPRPGTPPEGRATSLPKLRRADGQPLGSAGRVGREVHGADGYAERRGDSLVWEAVTPQLPRNLALDGLRHYEQMFAREA